MPVSSVAKSASNGDSVSQATTGATVDRAEHVASPSGVGSGFAEAITGRRDDSLPPPQSFDIRDAHAVGDPGRGPSERDIPI